MRYQAFYPFSNQRQSMSPGPPPPHFQGGTVQHPFSQGSPNPTSPQGTPQNPMQNGAQTTQTGISRADQYMQTANRFLNTAQQFAPLVQQVAPMIQNIPAMWRLYKGFQSMPDAPVQQNLRPGNPSVPSGPTSSIPNDQPAAPRIYQPPF